MRRQMCGMRVEYALPRVVSSRGCRTAARDAFLLVEHLDRLVRIGFPYLEVEAVTLNNAQSAPIR